MTRIRKDILKEGDIEFESGSLNRLDKHRRLTKNNQTVSPTHFLFRYILLLNGSSFSKILKDSYLFHHFIFLLHFSHSALIFDMTVLQKSRFAKLISKKFGIDKLMVIGSGYDILALRKYTNLLINIYPPKNKGSLLVLDGDLICTDFDVLNSFLFVDCFIYSIKLNQIILYIFYSSYILGNYYINKIIYEFLGWPIFFHWIFNNFSSVLFQENIEFIFKDSLLCVSSIAIFFYFGNHYRPILLVYFPEIAIEEKLRSKKILIIFLLEIVLRTFVESLFVYILIFYCDSYDEKARGTSSFSKTFCDIYTVDIFWIYLYFLNDMKRTFLAHAMAFISFSFFFIFTHAISHFSEMTLFKNSIIMQFFENFSNVESTLNFLLVFSNLLAVNYLINSYLHELIYKITVYTSIRSLFERKN